MPSSRFPLRTFCVVASLACLARSAGAADADVQAGYAHAADCVAALKPEATALADQLRAGNARIEPDLLRLTEAGFVFIGEAYKAGLRKEEADRMLASAEEAQKQLPEATRQRLATDCRAEGDKLLAEANPLERAMVSAAANKRIKRLREK